MKTSRPMLNSNTPFCFGLCFDSNICGLWQWYAKIVQPVTGLLFVYSTHHCWRFNSHTNKNKWKTITSKETVIVSYRGTLNTQYNKDWKYHQPIVTRFLEKKQWTALQRKINLKSFKWKRLHDANQRRLGGQIYLFPFLTFYFMTKTSQRKRNYLCNSPPHVSMEGGVTTL